MSGFKQKTCTKCHTSKPYTAFRQRKLKTMTSYRSHCRECERKEHRDWYSRNKEYTKLYQESRKTSTEDRRLNRIYGISLKDLNLMVKDQDNKCKICGDSFLNSRMCVDHCHKTGKIRGILCNKCNSGIGLLKDSRDVVKNAYNYLEEVQNES